MRLNTFLITSWLLLSSSFVFALENSKQEVLLYTDGSVVLNQKQQKLIVLYPESREVRDKLGNTILDSYGFPIKINAQVRAIHPAIKETIEKEVSRSKNISTNQQEFLAENQKPRSILEVEPRVISAPKTKLLLDSEGKSIVDQKDNPIYLDSGSRALALALPTTQGEIIRDENHLAVKDQQGRPLLMGDNGKALAKVIANKKTNKIEEGSEKLCKSYQWSTSN